MILFSKPSITKKEIKFTRQVLEQKVLTDGFFQNKAELSLKKKIKSNFVALTQSCTDALEMAANLIRLQPGDEVIMPSFTFTSTANAVVLKGAKPVFVDIKTDDLQTAKVILDLKRKKIVKNSANENSDYDELYDFYNKYYAKQIEQFTSQ